MMVRSHWMVTPALACELFRLTEDGYRQIMAGDDWRPIYDQRERRRIQRATKRQMQDRLVSIHR